VRKYGLVSAAMVVFSYTVSDFGIPKVIGGNFNVLAVDIFKQVIGQQNFQQGRGGGLILLVPVLSRSSSTGACRAAPGAVLGAGGSVRAQARARGSTGRCSLYCIVVAFLLLRCSAWPSTRRSSSSGRTTSR
jgi:iron(III) transport system permease protein